MLGVCTILCLPLQAAPVQAAPISEGELAGLMHFMYICS